LAVDALDRGASDVVLEGFAGREIALRLARQIARKHRLDQLRADMRDGLRAALTDPLTGLFNRRYAMPRLARIAKAAAQSGRDFAAMSIDVDHFKLINDRFGHAAGDAVLVQLAELLRGAVGEQDLVSRIGGEEFLIALPETSRTAAQMAAKRICNMVRDAAFPVPGRDRPLHVTVSIGVALLSDVQTGEVAEGVGMGTMLAPTLQGGDDETALHQQVLEQADKALYGAKAHGRNQVTLCNARSAA
jgi:two-component system cell cycle response regulator